MKSFGPRAISNHFAHHKHERETATWAANSPNAIPPPLCALVNEIEAKEFWEITPVNVKRKIVKFHNQAAAA